MSSKAKESDLIFSAPPIVAHPLGAPEGFPEVYLVHRGEGKQVLRDVLRGADGLGGVAWHSDVVV